MKAERLGGRGRRGGRELLEREDSKGRKTTEICLVNTRQRGNLIQVGVICRVGEVLVLDQEEVVLITGLQLLLWVVTVTVMVARYQREIWWEKGA